MRDATPRPVRIAILTVSDSRTLADDRSGDLLVSRRSVRGIRSSVATSVPTTSTQFERILANGSLTPNVEAIVSTGGTGVTGRDGTPEAVRVLLDKEIPGFGETFRAVSFGIIGTSTLQSRALAGVANQTYIFVLPGSTSACKDAWDHILHHQLDVRTKPCNLVELMPRLGEH